MPKKKVHVVFKDDEFVVEPPVIELQNGDELKLVNRTTEDLVWSVQDPAAFNGGAVLEIVKSKKFSSGKVAQNAPGLYEYQALMIKSGKKAKGNSDPVIIIEN